MFLMLTFFCQYHRVLITVAVFFEGMFIKAGYNETKKGLRVEEATEESLRDALLWLPRSFTGKE